MKNILILLSLTLLFDLTINAQENILHLYGTIKHSISDTITLSNHYCHFTTITDKNGKFSFKEEVEDPDFLNLSIRGHNLTMFLLGGDTLELNCNINSFFNSINYKGERAELNKQLILLSSGFPAPEFTLTDLNGNIVKLSDFKGKYVYIDVWNSACRPCFKEFQRFDDLIDKYNGKDIVFVGISLDRNTDIWKKTIEKKNLQGVQLFGQGWKSDFTSNYYIKFNPRFILIGKDQNYIYSSAPRPTGNIEQILDELIN